MNILQEKQTQESQGTICKTHNLEYIAVDLDMSDKSSVLFFCGKCLVDKLNNQKVTTIQQSKERIQQMKTQQQEIKIKENQARLKYYKSILDQIMEFKRSIDDSLEKMYKQIQEYIFPIQKEKQELLEFQQSSDYFQDIKLLSEQYSSNIQKSTKLIEDNNFIDEITRQFELLFNNAEYFQSLDILKNSKQIIQDLMENNIINLPPLLVAKNEFKTPSLNKVCTNHQKEIIMIDMDSQNKKIENRFACVDCIAQNPQTKYQTIEFINKQWIDCKQESERILSEYKKESKDKKSDLFNQISQMRKNYNKKLNEISEKLIAESFQSIDRSQEQNQKRKISIQVLEDEQLLKDLKQLIDKERVTQNQAITSFINKESIFKKEIENHLQSLKQYNQQDIQQSLDLLKETTIEGSLIVQLQELLSQFSICAQKKDENNQDQIEIIKDIQELIDKTKQYQCQINIFDQTISLYQQHTNKIDQIKKKILNQTKDQVNKQELINTQYQNLSNVLDDYIINIDNKYKQIKKYCSIQEFEMELIKQTEQNKLLEIEKNNLLNQMSKKLDEKQQEHQQTLKKQSDEYQRQIKEIDEKLKQQEKESSHHKKLFDEKTQEIVDLKKQNEKDKLLTISTFEEKKKIEIAEIDKTIKQKDTELQTLQRKLDQINQEQLAKEKLQQLEQEQKQISLNYQKSLQFSNIYKGAKCQVSEGGKVVECQGDHFKCLCDQVIPKTGKISFAFQILSLTSEVFVGIGFRDIIKQENYKYANIGYGTYFIRNNGETSSHHNNDENAKASSLTYTNNDIIIIEVSIDHKYIKWTKYNNPNLAVVQLQIDTSISSELYPCVYVYNSKVKILDNIPM